MLIVSGALAAGVCGAALYRLVMLVLGHQHPDRARLAVFAVVLLAGFVLGVMSVLAGLRAKQM